MVQENDYVNYFYDKYEGRVAIGVGYNQDLSEIYPFVFEDTDGKSIGIVALGVIIVGQRRWSIFSWTTRRACSMSSVSGWTR